MSENKFDNIAFNYDRTFTNTHIGRLQRKFVHQYLEKIMRNDTTGDVLELNAGTGEDALFFAKKGWQVFATDISAEMLEAGKRKAKTCKLESRISFGVCDIKRLDELHITKKYDLVFSNFGGLNCLDKPALQQLSLQIAALLKPGGRFIAVVMPKFCLWENGYFLTKFKPKTAFRRNTNHPVSVPVGSSQVETRYFNPAGFGTCFKPFFRRTALLPIGLCIPPSYMEIYFKDKPRLLGIFDSIEKMLNKVPVFANISDHFLIELQPSRP